MIEKGLIKPHEFAKVAFILKASLPIKECTNEVFAAYNKLALKYADNESTASILFDDFVLEKSVQLLSSNDLKCKKSALFFMNNLIS